MVCQQLLQAAEQLLLEVTHVTRLSLYQQQQREDKEEEQKWQCELFRRCSNCTSSSTRYSSSSSRKAAEM
jgi:hypothetical protein